MGDDSEGGKTHRPRPSVARAGERARGADRDEDDEYVVSDPVRSPWTYKPGESLYSLTPEAMCQGPCLTDQDIYGELDTYKHLDAWRAFVRELQPHLARIDAEVPRTWSSAHVADIRLIHQRLASGTLSLDSELRRAIRFDRQVFHDKLEQDWILFVAGAQLTAMVDRTSTKSPADQAVVGDAHDFIRVNAQYWTALGNHYLHGKGSRPKRTIDLTEYQRPVLEIKGEVVARGYDAKFVREKAAARLLYAPFEALGAAGRYLVGLLAGAAEGIYACIKDALMAIPDLAGLALDLLELQGKLIAALFTGDLFDMLKKLIDQIGEIIEKAPGALGKLWDEFKRNWFHDDLWTRGTFQGKVVGYLLTEIALALVSVGAVTAAKLAAKGGKLAKFVQALRAVDTLSDPVAVARRVGLADKVDDVGDAVRHADQAADAIAHAERAAAKASKASIAKVELDAALETLGAKLGGRLSANPFLDPEIWQATYDVAKLAVRSGIKSFDAFLATLASSRKLGKLDFDNLSAEHRAHLEDIYQRAIRAEEKAAATLAAKIPDPHTPLAPALAAKRTEVLTSLDEFVRTDSWFLNVKKADPDARIAVQGSVVRGTVGNPRKPRYGLPFAPDDFDLDIFVISDKLPQTKEVVKLSGARDRLNRSFPGVFEGLKGGGSGLSVKVVPSKKPLPDAVMFLGE